MHYSVAYDVIGSIEILSKTPFSLKITNRAVVPALIGYNFSCTSLQIACGTGNVRAAKRLLKLSDNSDQNSPFTEENLLEAFEIATVTKMDVTAIVMLHRLWPSDRFSNFIGEHSPKLLSYCAENNLYRTFAALISKYSGISFKPSKVQINPDSCEVRCLWDPLEAKKLFDLCAANGRYRSCIILLRYMNVISMCPPVIQANNMPIFTFTELVKGIMRRNKRLFRSKKANSLKKGPWNIFYSEDNNFSKASSLLMKNPADVAMRLSAYGPQRIEELNDSNDFHHEPVENCLSSRRDRQDKVVIISVRGRTAMFCVPK